jgi:hypothetical protein
LILPAKPDAACRLEPHGFDNQIVIGSKGRQYTAACPRSGPLALLRSLQLFAQLVPVGDMRRLDVLERPEQRLCLIHIQTVAMESREDAELFRKTAFAFGDVLFGDRKIAFDHRSIHGVEPNTKARGTSVP